MEDGDDNRQVHKLPAIEALGSLFKLTQVHFWIDLYSGMPCGSTSKTVKDDDIFSSTTGSTCSRVDTELSRQMNELGLPLSFCTNKEGTLQSHFLNWEAFLTILKPKRSGTERSKERGKMPTRKYLIPKKKPQMKFLAQLNETILAIMSWKHFAMTKNTQQS